MWSSSARSSHRRQTSSSRLFSIVRTWKAWSFKNRSWIPWNFLFAFLLQLDGQIIFFSLPASYHIDVLEVVLSWWRTLELKGPSYTWWFSDSLFFLYARSARMCNRRCQCSSMENILCTAFWVSSRAIQTVLRYPHPESFVFTLDWKD